MNNDTYTLTFNLSTDGIYEAQCKIREIKTLIKDREQILKKLEPIQKALKGFSAALCEPAEKTPAKAKAKTKARFPRTPEKGDTLINLLLDLMPKSESDAIPFRDIIKKLDPCNPNPRSVSAYIHGIEYGHLFQKLTLVDGRHVYYVKNSRSSG